MNLSTKKINKGLPKNVLTKSPTGKWGFVGSVDMRLSFVKEVGTDSSGEAITEIITPADVKLIAERASFGEAFVYSAGFRRRSWDTAEHAVEAARGLGISASPATE